MYNLFINVKEKEKTPTQNLITMEIEGMIRKTKYRKREKDCKRIGGVSYIWWDYIINVFCIFNQRMSEDANLFFFGFVSCDMNLIFFMVVMLRGSHPLPTN